MNEIKQIEPEYVYVTIPAEYICVYHRILAMMADYGEDMLKDCKANCTDRNSGVIECFNMFNSAVAARKLGKDKLAALIIKYIKAKINQIYKDKDNSTSFVFPIDENGELKAIVSCGERPKFHINSKDMNLYEHKLNNGFDEHFVLGDEDLLYLTNEDYNDFIINFNPTFESYDNTIRACCELSILYKTNVINPKRCSITYYYDDMQVYDYKDIVNPTIGEHKFVVVIKAGALTKIITKIINYNENDI